MSKYYFVAPSLPPLVLGEHPELSFEEVVQRLEMNLTKKDLQTIALLRLPIDLSNIKALYLARPLDPRGNLSEKQLDEALLVGADLPSYIFEFLDQFEENRDKARHHFGLLSRYFVEEGLHKRGFMKWFLELQREMHLVLTAIRAKKQGRDIKKELQFEDPTDPFVAHIFAQSDMEHYVPPPEFEDLVQRLGACGSDPWEQYKVVMSYEFDQIEERGQQHLFSSDWIFGYIARLIIVEKWAALDEERGREILARYKTGSE